MLSESKLRPTQENKRYYYLDIAKGILIVLVVLGHSSFEYDNFIYWFHMPAFFMISGVLHRQPVENDLRKVLIRRAGNLLVPYLAYGLLITVIVFFNKIISDPLAAIKYGVYQLRMLIMGGGALRGNFGVFWYITCLFVTIVAFTMLIHYVQNSFVYFTTLAFSFVFGLTLSKYIHVNMPWSVNVVFIAIVFYAIGYHARTLMPEKIRISLLFLVLTIVLILFCGWLIFSVNNHYFDFYLNMKNSSYANPLMTLVVPVFFTIAIIMISIIVEKTRIGEVLTSLGLNSLAIMYLHIPINNLIASLFHLDPSYILFLTYGVLIPVTVAYIFNKNSITQSLFLGKNSNNLFKPLVFLRRKNVKHYPSSFVK